MFKNKILKTGVGLLLSVSLLSAGMGGNTASAACKHSFTVAVLGSTSVRAQGKHQFYNESKKVWEDCTRKDIVEWYAYRCKKCGEYNGTGYTKEYFTHSNEKCYFYPIEGLEAS